MPNIGDREESLETLGLAFLSKSHGNVPLCLNFPHLGKRQAEGWKGFEVEDESNKGMVMNNNSNISPNNPGVDVGGGRAKGRRWPGREERKNNPGTSSQSDRRGLFQWPPLDPTRGAAGEDSKRGLDQGTEPRTTTLTLGPAGRALAAAH